MIRRFSEDVDLTCDIRAIAPDLIFVSCIAMKTRPLSLYQRARSQAPCTPTRKWRYGTIFKMSNIFDTLWADR